VAGKNKREAVDNFAGYIRESLSCISDAYVLVYQASANIFKIFYEQPVKLNSEEGLYLFSVVQICSALEDAKYGGFKAKTEIIATRSFAYRARENPKKYYPITGIQTIARYAIHICIWDASLESIFRHLGYA
jgi:hypothetical protein